jgi:hypothetical protein
MFENELFTTGTAGIGAEKWAADLEPAEHLYIQYSAKP